MRWETVATLTVLAGTVTLVGWSLWGLCCDVRDWQPPRRGQGRCSH